MTTKPVVRDAIRSDLKALVELEESCFTSDRVSRRSFSHLIKAEHSRVLVLSEDGSKPDALLGYMILLFRTGTNLCRLYSIAISAHARGRGLSRHLMQHAEEVAREQGAAFMRLEVSLNNETALQLYNRLGYHRIAKLTEYYEDGSDGWRMEKRIRTASRPLEHTPYYAQTTPFSCGPSSLLMAMASLNKDYSANRTDELTIWRESTTVYMTSGHGGCSPVGLAVSAKRRGFNVELYLSSDETPFIDSVRDNEKRSVIEQVHNDYLSELAALGVKPRIETLSSEQLVAQLKQGRVALCLISTWRLNRNKAPHWVLATGADDRFIYFSDPDVDDAPWHSEADYIDTPIGQDQYQKMARYGRSRFSATLILSR